MNLLGIDVGTTGVKVALFSPEGIQLAGAYREHVESRPQPGYAELDAAAVWESVQSAIREVRAQCAGLPIRALSISSMGEAVVPVTRDRRILAPSMLNYDPRGEEFVKELAPFFKDEFLYPINGNTFGNQYSLTKIKWIQRHQPELYARTDSFLHWSAFIGFMLGADPAVDYALANRTLLFDLDAGDWSEALIQQAGIDRSKLPPTVPPGTRVGTVDSQIATMLGLPPGVAIVSGAHDQCANAVGCGVIESGSAVYGMGTYLCITPVFSQRQPAQKMIPLGLNTEHHAVPDRFVSFLYNQGGALVKWYRDTFAAAEHKAAQARGKNTYPALFAEMPDQPGDVLVLPHFAPTGPPRFIADSCGKISGLRLETTRGEILRGIVEGVTFYLKDLVDSFESIGGSITDYRAVGGGSQSDAWVQISADILGKPMIRPKVTEAGALGAAMMAGVGSGAFHSYPEAVEAMVHMDRVFEPDRDRHQEYLERFERYKRFADTNPE
ncbi:MAG: hypothetical protein JW750_05945 [Anaerolineaceae bacterium]|nr:hypothetical protein [Anaerolineaceae bacterium]